MSRAGRHHRLRTLAAALGVGISVMAGQGIASADESTDNTGSSDSSASDTESGSTAPSSESTTESTEPTAPSTPHSDTPGSTIPSHTDDDHPEPPIVRGNGLSNTETVETQPEPETQPQPETRPEAEPATPAETTNSSERTSRRSAASTQQHETSQPDVPESTTPSEPTLKVASSPAETASAAVVLASETMASPIVQFQAPTIEVPKVAAPQNLTADFAPLAALLTLPALPPLNPLPGPPIPPLTWAFAVTNRRNGTETPSTPAATTLSIATTAATNSATVTPGPTPIFTIPRLTLPTTGIPAVDALLQQVAAEFNRTWANAAPTATATTPTQQANGTVTGTITATDLDGDPVTYTITQAPTKGTVTVDQSTGTYTYTPTDPTLSGTDSHDTFIITVTDGKRGILDWLTPADEHASTVTVELENANTPPDPVGIEVDHVDEETGEITGHFVVNDQDGDSIVKYEATDTTDRGMLTVNPDGTFTYLPDEDERYAAGASGMNIDTFEITVTDSRGATTSTELGVEIVPLDRTTTDSQGVSSGVIVNSPDGKHTLYVTTKDGKQSIAVVDIATGAVSPVSTQTTGSFGEIAFDAEGKRAYVVTSKTVVVINPDETTTNVTTTYVTVINVETGAATETREVVGNFRDLAAPADGDNALLVVADNTASGWQSRIYSIDGDTGIPTKILDQTGDADIVLAGEDAYVYSTAGGRTYLTHISGDTAGPTRDYAGSSRFAVASDGNSAVLITSVNGASGFTSEIRTFDGNGDQVGATIPVVGVNGQVPQYTPDGKHVYVRTLDGTERTYMTVVDATTGVGTTSDQAGQGYFYVNSTGTRAAFVTFDINTRTTIIDLETLAPIGTTTEQTGIFPQVTVAPDGEHVFVVSSPYNSGQTYVSVIDTAAGDAVKSGPISGSPETLVVTPDSKQAYLSLSDGTSTSVVVFDTATGGWRDVVTKTGSEVSLQATADSLHVILATSNSVTVIDTTNQQFVEIPVPNVQSVRLTDDGAYAVVLSSESGEIKVRSIDLATGTASTPGGQPGTLRPTETSPDGERIYVTSRTGSGPLFDTTVKVYDIETGTLLDTYTFEDHRSSFATDVVEIDGDEYLIVTYSNSGTGSDFTIIRTWRSDLET